MNKFKTFVIFIFFSSIFLNVPVLLRAQFITSPGTSDEKYGNYSEEGYRNYSQEFLTLKHYDDFGNFLLEGLNVYRLTKQSPAEADNLIKYRYYTNWFENLVIAKDSYKGFSTSLIIGDAIRTKFTSLTLDRARFNGIRWDGKTNNNQFSVVYSRLSDPIFMPFQTTVTGSYVSAPHDWNRYLFGGHWETEVGDVLTLGATYLNLHQTKSKDGTGDSSIKGEVADSKPEYIILIFADDSIEDGSGSKLYSRPKVYINDELIDTVPLEETTYPREANGKDYFFLTIPISSQVTVIRSIKIAVVVSNDYRIFAGHLYRPSQTELDLVSTHFQVVKQAKGNVKDESNKRVEIIDYSLDTGRSIYGFNFTANLFGFRINGEYERNVRYSKFPIFVGNRYEKKSEAYFIQMQRNLGPLTLGGEYFKIDPEYFTSLITYSQERGATAYNSTAAFDSGGVYDWLVDDNDDNDRYEDGVVIYQATLEPIYVENTEELFNPENPRPDAGIFPGLDENNDGIPDDDQNSNGIPDYNEPFMMYYNDPPRFDYGDDWNNNDVIDVRENDRLPDHIYNRDLTGHHLFLKYRLLRGLNITGGLLKHHQIAGGGKNNIKYGKLEYNLDLPKFARANIYHVTKRVQDDIPDPTYQFSITDQGVNFTAPKFAGDDLTMRNSMVYTTYLGSKYIQIPNLTIENNVKHVLNSQKKIAAWDGDQQQFITDQEESQISYWGIVNKVDYKVKLTEQLALIPQLKHRWEIKYQEFTSADKDTFFHNQWLMPIVRLDYSFTERTVIRMGFQGFSFKGIHEKLNDGDFFVYRYRDKLNPANNTNNRIFMIMVTNASDYNGYKLQFNIGFQNIKTTYTDEYVAYKNKSYSRFFVKVIAGW